MGESETLSALFSADKISKVKINLIAAYKKTCSLTIAEMPQYFVTSATESLGKEEVLNIDEVNQIFKNNSQFSYFKTIWPWRAYL
jgi:GTP-binding protein